MVFKSNFRSFKPRLNRLPDLEGLSEFLCLHDIWVCFPIQDTSTGMFYLLGLNDAVLVVVTCCVFMKVWKMEHRRCKVNWSSFPVFYSIAFGARLIQISHCRWEFSDNEHLSPPVWGSDEGYLYILQSLLSAILRKWPPYLWNME